MEATTLKDARKERNQKIKMRSSEVANLILRRWPDDSPVDLLGHWLFDGSQCHRRIKGYSRSISENIQLRDHVLELQGILQRHENVQRWSIPATVPYKFSPKFITSRSMAPSYLFHDVLLSRTDVPTPLVEQPVLVDTIPTTVTVGTLVPVGSDSLKILIEELRHSRQPLLELYGNELNRSHHELMGHSASQAIRGAVPTHELLRHHHDQCFRRKDEAFSEISASLAPSQNVEKANAAAGLWPRITPRSLLHQLAQGRIGTLSDQWKAVITRYAICLLKYQQSQRLLELSSSQKREELLREIDSTRSDVLAESTPDWLLVQVRPLRFRRSD
jgi:hypothetical protein